MRSATLRGTRAYTYIADFLAASPSSVQNLKTGSTPAIDFAGFIDRRSVLTRLERPLGFCVSVYCLRPRLVKSSLSLFHNLLEVLSNEPLHVRISLIALSSQIEYIADIRPRLH